MRYNGKGFLHGIPARNLSEAEVRKFGAALLLASGLYERLPVERKHKKIVAVETAEV